MLEFQLSSGHVFYLNHLISMLFMSLFFYWTCWVIAKKQYDKAIHIGVCTGATILGLWIFPLIHWPWWIVPIAVLFVGLGKEIWDYFNPKKRKFDPMDLLADCVGTLPITIMYLLSFVLHNPKF